MTVSVRLRRGIDAKLSRFCKNRKISKTDAMERGLESLLEQDGSRAHAADLMLCPTCRLPNRKAFRNLIGR